MIHDILEMGQRKEGSFLVVFLSIIEEIETKSLTPLQISIIRNFLASLSIQEKRRGVDFQSDLRHHGGLAHLFRTL